MRRAILGTIGVALVLFIIAQLHSIAKQKRYSELNVTPSNAQEISSISADQRAVLLDHLRQNGLPPADFVVGQFKDHQLVLVGEMHEQRETCELISELIPRIYNDAGVRYLALEIIKNKYNARLDSLINSDTYDQELACDIFRNTAWPMWGFKEYIDILHSAWELNRSIAEQENKFHIIGLDSDWSGYDLLCGSIWTKADDFFKAVRRDKFMAQILENEIIDKDRKALVLAGLNHTFTNCSMPKVKNGEALGEAGPRMGLILKNKYGDRISQICVHQYFLSPDAFLSNEEPGNYRKPLMVGFLDSLFAESGTAPLALEIKGSPFETLRDSTCGFFAFQKRVTLGDIAENFVFFGPLREMHKVSWADGFINETNFNPTREILLKKTGVDVQQKILECNTPEKLDRLLQDEIY